MSRRARASARPGPREAAAPRPAASLAPALHALAAVLIAGAVGWSEGLYDPFSLALVTVATALVALAAWTPRGLPLIAEHGPTVVLALGVAGGLAFDALFLPGVVVEPSLLGGFRPALGALAAVLATQLWPRPPRALAALRTPLAVAAWLIVAGIVLRASPAPGIDVWQLQQAGALALAGGDNPYALLYPNPFGPGNAILAPEVLTPDGAFIRAFPYPPLTLLAGVLPALAGDVRFGLVLATAAAAVLVYLLGGRSRAAELAAAFLLVQPRTLMVMELSWTEPLVLALVLALALALNVARRPGPGEGATPGRWMATALLAGLAVASKQYALLLVLPFAGALPPLDRTRIVVAAAGVAAALHLPFLLWDPGALWRGLVGFQLAQPFRPDALSWLAAVVAWGGPELPPWPAFLAAFAVIALAGRRVRSVADALGAGALAWLVLVLGNKQAFANYYWLAVGLLCAAAAAGATRIAGEPGAAPRKAA